MGIPPSICYWLYIYVYTYIINKNSILCLLIDHDRPLSEAGEADAIKVSQKLHQLGWVPELILSRLVLLCIASYHNI